MRRAIGLAVRLPDTNRAVWVIARRKRIPLYGRPKELDIPGAVVALVQANGKVALLARATALSGPKSVTLFTGRRTPGYELHLSRITKPQTTRKLPIRWRAVGQFRYFNPKKWAAMILGKPVDRPTGTYLDDALLAPGQYYIPTRPFINGLPRKHRNRPEADLIRSYVTWVGAEDEFQFDYLYAERLFTDLFDRSKWRLFEAKIHCDRKTIRTAVGQLFDYKRFYVRAPSLGVLFGSRPTVSCLSFLSDCGVTAIWRTPRGRFRDSTDERTWTTLRRR